ncbi:MAG: glycoside hydrolase family 30 protein [Bacilli bacterium]|nr:glycoside hydrolase family 30 protein [Bacilli bacterium]MBN2696320.1 glycoside hydrolase family 30 protein [Bacilli bacterium]
MIRTIVTAKDTNHRLSLTDELRIKKVKTQATIKLDPSKRFQDILGFGGAFTESACYNLYRVSGKVREEALKLYFDPLEGIGYTMGRVSIHGCDFSLSSYTYIEEGDSELKTFDISRDHNYVIPSILRAQELAGKTLNILASPWTPPAFMKDNNSPIRGGHLLPQFADSWAKYYVRFIEEYQKSGIYIWGITVQNEPEAAQRWDSCLYSGPEERDFLKHHLGPVMQSNFGDNIKILILDHNRDIIIDRAKAVFSDPEAAKYAWGTAFHWYVSNAFENVGKVHEMYPDKGLLFTEGCIEGGVRFNDWSSGERYATQMIGDLSNWCQGYIDWNLFLDNLGGPNHVNNLCDAPIIIDIYPEKLILQSSYYYIGHFSKFVKPGAHRIKHDNSNSDLSVIAFENPDLSIATIILNKTEQDIVFNLSYDSENSYIAIARSITTIIIE